MAISQARDLLAQSTLRAWLNSRFEQLGRMTSLQIDSQTKTLRFELELKGETQPLTVHVGRYQLIEQGEKTWLQLGQINTSREWLNALVASCFPEPQFEVPALVKMAL